MHAILSIGILLIGIALFLRFANIERERISYDRAANRMLATVVYNYYSSLFKQKLEILGFAIQGLERDGYDEESLKALKQAREDVLKAVELLTADYHNFMMENQPLRSLFPPWDYIYPEREGAYLEMDPIE